MSHTHTLPNNHHSKQISERLQREVESILSSSNEQAIYGEFTRDEIVASHLDTKDTIIEEVVEEERMFISPRTKRFAGTDDTSLLEKSTSKVPVVGKKLGSAVTFLFKRFEY